MGAAKLKLFNPVSLSNPMTQSPLARSGNRSVANAMLASMLAVKRSMKATGWVGRVRRGKQETEGPRMLRPAVAFLRCHLTHKF